LTGRGQEEKADSNGKRRRHMKLRWFSVGGEKKKKSSKKGF